MKLVPVEYHAWGDKWNEKQHTWERFEETGITYERIPTTRKEKIKKKIDNIEMKIFHVLSIILFPIICIVYCIVDRFILKNDDTKQKKKQTSTKI